MKVILCIQVYLLFATTLIYGQDTTNSFNRNAYYSAMEQDKMDLIDQQLTRLKTFPLSGIDKDAFMGALMMKKAGLSGNPGKKLDLFKSGHRQLEAAIRKDTANVEFRFLRLIIQEHSPRVLGYKGAMKTDSEYIRKSYNKLSKELQQVVIKYSKKSKILVLGNT